MKAAVLFEALAILRHFKDSQLSDEQTGIKWYRVMSAHNNLEFALMQAGLVVDVEPVKAEEVAA